MIVNSFSKLEMIINTAYVKYIYYMLSNPLNAFVGKERETERFIPLVSDRTRLITRQTRLCLWL